MRKIILPLFLVFAYTGVFAQKQVIRITVVNEQKNALPGATVYLLNTDSVVIRSGAASASGIFEFTGFDAGKYLVRVSQAGYKDGYSPLISPDNKNLFSYTVILTAKSNLLNDVTVVSKKPAIQFLPDKTVINPEAGISNAGATVMDVLEKSPGITVAKDGSIIMKGKPSVTVLIDGKPTQLSGTDLQAYLSGIPASQVDVVELIENPGAKYDASGNAGIINIKMKANKVKGFNGSMNLSAGQGIYSKTNNSLNLNYRNGKVNWFMNYGMRYSKDMMDIWTLRTYVNSNNQDSVLLEQPNANKSSNTGHNIKTGFDFFLNKKTTLGIVFTGGLFNRKAKSYSDINWMDPNHNIDSTINTSGENNRHFKRGGVNINGKFKINESSELLADLDYVSFTINGDQQYQTQLLTPVSAIEATKGNIPSRLNIFAAKVDYSKRFKKFLLETGLKTAFNKTDNLAAYYYSDNNNPWQPDLSRSNHFLYNETISAAYASADAEKGKWHGQAGLRYEFTSYKAHQLGNTVVKDSAFKRNYGSIFPTAFVSYQADSNNSITFRLGKRIDRPPFQNLNPFLTTLNKYTFEGGNPFIKPQYTWNFALAHTYKQMLTTEISYSYLKDYFSQIFIIDSNRSNVNKNIIIYTRGNVGSFQNFGITETFQYPLTKWWNLTAVAVYNYKIIKGVVWAPLQAKVSQLNISINNQFQLKKGWSFELSGFYQTRSQIDLQEWLTPQGELNAGVAKQVLKKKGTVKLSIRDITWFQNYSGYSTFQNSYEPFTIKWDSRVVRLSFSWRFGKAMKAVSRSEGGASDEINRVGN
ncbi:MAG: TonB-dependent receptor [Chitinophagaceae bacterium]|nr:TonB-dependent receptor [Chitinophagaceae bacterium]